MMKIGWLSFLVVLLNVLFSVSYAHHSYAGVFDMTSLNSLQGKVVKLELFNPHTHLYLEVVDDHGRIEEWVVEGPGKVSLARRGWVDDMFLAGETVTVFGNPSVQGKRALWLHKIVKSDGSEYVDPLVADTLVIEAARRAKLLQLKQPQNQ